MTTGGPPRDTPKLHGDIKDYRQPLVTSLGIILGFLLSYLAGWANASDGALLSDGADIATFVTLAVAVTLLVIVLWRMLTPSIPPDDALRHYRLTVRMYLAGIIIAFSGFFIAWII